MTKRYSTTRPEMNWQVQDVSDMTLYRDNYFDIVIDKGTLDALLCDANADINVRQMIDEIKRVLKDGGNYIVISFHKPCDIQPRLKSAGF